MSKKTYGGSAENQYTQSAPGNPAAVKSNQKWIVIILVIFVLLAAAACFVLIMNSKKETPLKAYTDLLTSVEKNPESLYKGIDDIEDYDFSLLDNSEDEFSVVDIDGDSVPELIINVKSAGEDNSFALIYECGDSGSARLRGAMAADPEIYSGGIVVSTRKNNGSELTIVKKYDESTNRYVNVFRYNKSDSDDTYYGAEYVYNTPGNSKGYTYDGLVEYLEENYLSGQSLLDIEYIKINDENIEKISSEGAAEAKTKAEKSTVSDDAESDKEQVSASDIKIGLILSGSEYTAGDSSFVSAAKAACEKTGAVLITKSNEAEDDTCYETAVGLARSGCSLIISDDADYEEYMLQAAQEFSGVQFCVVTGIRAHTERLSNYHNAYAAIHEARYLTGIAAGLKLNQMIENGEISQYQATLGFVGTYREADVISAYSAFYLGAKSVCEDVKMKVRFTNEDFDVEAEREAAERLISGGCVLLSQSCVSSGVQAACEEAGVPDIAYGTSDNSAYENTVIMSSEINWQPYFEYIIGCMTDKEDTDIDWLGTIDTGSVVLSDISETAAAPGTANAIKEAEEGLKDGTVKVFDTENFTQYGYDVTTYYADVDYDSYGRGDTEAIVNGEFKESIYRSAPYFDLKIDGITLLNY